MQDYYSRFFALAKPPGKEIFEFLFIVRDEKAVLSKITAELSKHNVNILTLYGSHDPEIDAYVMTFFCDFANADCTAESAADKIRKFPFVRTVRYASSKGKLFDSFHFPIRMMDSSRAVLMRVDPLLMIEADLEKMMGSAGEVIMYAQGKSYSKQTLENYKSALSGYSTEEILSNAIDGLRATGWGIFEFRPEKDGFRVSIKSPAKLEGNNQTKNRFLLGVSAGVLESLYKVELKVVDSSYEEKSDTLTVELRAMQSKSDST